MYALRPLRSADNAAIRQVVIDVLTEHGYAQEGYAYADPELADLHGYYTAINGDYLVVVDDEDRVVGGGGVGTLKGTQAHEGICEIQKCYFLPQVRGHGLGKRLVEELLAIARGKGFRRVYIETTPDLKTAIAVYEKYGFERIPGPLGCTGHSEKCSVQMALTL